MKEKQPRIPAPKLPQRVPPLALPVLSVAEIASIKALMWGTATQHQQVMAFDTILKKICSVGGCSFWTDPYVSAFAEGKRYVGTQLMAIVEPNRTRQQNTEQPL